MSLWGYPERQGLKPETLEVPDNVRREIELLQSEIAAVEEVLAGDPHYTGLPLAKRVDVELKQREAALRELVKAVDCLNSAVTGEQMREDMVKLWPVNDKARAIVEGKP